MRPTKRITLAAPALLLSLLPVRAGAQVVPDTARGGDTVAIPLTPIRVTVLRAPIRLSRAAHAVTVERVEASGPGLSLAESLGSVPGLQVDNRYNFSQGDRISVRGLGARSPFGVRGVKVMVDGIPATMADGQTSLSHVDPRWVERAEVLRGPASSLWGNAAGGVIQLETASAPLSGGVASGTVLSGSHGLRYYGAEVGVGSAPCTAATAPGGRCAAPGGAPAIGIRAAASGFEFAGFREHAAADKRFGTARVDWQDGRDAVTVVAHAVDYEAQNPGGLTSALLAADRGQAFSFNVEQNAGESAKQAQVGLTWRRVLGTVRDWGLGLGSQTPAMAQVTAWALSRELVNPIPPAFIRLTRFAAGFRGSVNGALRVGGRAVDWVAGMDAEGQWDDRLNFENTGGTSGTLELAQAETVTAVGPFVEARTRVAGPLRATVGLRYDRYDFTAHDRLVGPDEPDDSGRRTMSQWSPSLGLTLEAGAGSVYGNVASSFETPTTTELGNRPDGGAGFNPSLEPQRAWTVELGGRTRIGRRVRVHGAVYRMAIADALIPFEDASAPGRTFFRNAGSAIHQGVELDTWARLASGLSLRLGWAWVDAHFDDYVIDGVDVSGNRVPGVAPHRVTGSVAWSGPGASRLELAGRWVDAIPVNDANAARAPAYSTVDIQATLPTLPLGNGVTIFGGVDNALGAEYTSSVVVNAFGGRYFEPGPGRTGYVGLQVRP